ncbi:MAG: DUF1638 domain-containing protein [Candidatus Methanofastidiosum sp.]|nr:DUF1638 domain-containing protein [Methanofastidiosum sp.]
MKRIGIVVCQIFEDELLEILGSFPEIDKILIYYNEASKAFQEIAAKNLPPEKFRIVRELCSVRFLKRESDFEVLLYLLPLALHVDPPLIKNEVASAAKELEKHVDYLVVFFGLCGNSLGDVEALMKESKVEVPVVILKDSQGEIVDDCVCALIGSRNSYVETINEEPGTWFMTYGWAKYWRELSCETVGSFDINKMKLVFDKTGYKRTVAVDLDFGDKELYYERCKEFSEIFNLPVCHKKGDINILKKALGKAIEEVLDD